MSIWTFSHVHLYRIWADLDQAMNSLAKIHRLYGLNTKHQWKFWMLFNTFSVEYNALLIIIAPKLRIIHLKEFSVIQIHKQDFPLWLMQSSFKTLGLYFKVIRHSLFTNIFHDYTTHKNWKVTGSILKLTYSLISCVILGHQNLIFIVSFVLLKPLWPPIPLAWNSFKRSAVSPIRTTLTPLSTPGTYLKSSLPAK